MRSDAYSVGRVQLKPLDDGLKQRVVGALVLLALAVIFLPALFDRDPMAPVSRDSQIPEAPQVLRVEIGAPVVPEDSTSAPEPELMYVPEIADEVGEVPEAPGIETDGTPKAWVLQVASFRQRDLADTLSRKLNDKGYPGYVREVPHPDGILVRVFVGPKLDKQTLLTVKAAVEREFGLQGMVLPFKPE
jgi:DedD protein